MLVQYRRGGVRLGTFKVETTSSSSGALAVTVGGVRRQLMRDRDGWFVGLPPLPPEVVQPTYADNLAALKDQAQFNADGLQAGADKTAWLSVVSTLTTAISQIP